MLKEIDMYCMCKKDGALVPIQFRVEDENQELQTIKVKRYKEPKNQKEIYRGYHTAQYTVRILYYDVVVEINGAEKIMQLCYNISDHKWGIIV